MRLYESFAEIAPKDFAEGSALAIGKFDGVHCGHRALLRRVTGFAEATHLVSAVLTFSNNPLSILNPKFCPQPVMSRQQRIEELATFGLDSCVIPPFDEHIARMPAEQFVEQLLVRQLRVRHLCLGADFRFGHGGAGDAKLLQRLGAELGFSVEVVDFVEVAGEGRVSSSRVREAILQGDMERATRMLGRTHALRGEVVHGDARGRDLGFPTANLGGGVEGLRPADGVYAGWAQLRGTRHAAAISVGANVTFDPDGDSRVEAHLLDVNDDIYGAPLKLCFVRRLRQMTAFSTVEALIARMHEDVREVRAALHASA